MWGFEKSSKHTLIVGIYPHTPFLRKIYLDFIILYAIFNIMKWIFMCY